MSALASILIGGATGTWTAASGATDVVEQQVSLPVLIGGQDEQLETLIVRPAGEGRFPIALIANGAFANPKDLHPSGLAYLAHDFAHRGWLAAVVAWRGYGTSSGTVQSEAGNCTAPHTRRFLDAHAADLASALTALRTRPDVNPAITLGLGISIGGVSMLDLAAQADHPLIAVVNISGGLWHNAKPFEPDPACGPFEADLVHEMAMFGAAHVPTLWMYAENDPWFRPELVRRMSVAYRQGGGRVDLTMFPPFGVDGHTLFRWEASVLTQPAIDRFLRSNGLPAMAGDDGFTPVLATLDPDDRDLVEYYLRMPTEKALAIPEDGDGVYLSYARRSIDDAIRQALTRCKAASRKACHVVAENGVMSGIWRNPPSRDGER